LRFWTGQNGNIYSKNHREENPKRTRKNPEKGGRNISRLPGSIEAEKKKKKAPEKDSKFQWNKTKKS